MSSDRRAIRDAYLRTAYRATIDGERVEMRIGEVSEEVDRHLRARGAKSWAFVTASNPHAMRLGQIENTRRHAQLVAAVAAEGFAFFEGEGVGDDGSWPPERSLLIIGISATAASRIARGFEQEAIVVGALDEAARLVLCEGEA